MAARDHGILFNIQLNHSTASERWIEAVDKIWGSLGFCDNQIRPVYHVRGSRVLRGCRTSLSYLMFENGLRGHVLLGVYIKRERPAAES